jgi:Flp pilus assembly protein protease CpaA
MFATLVAFSLYISYKDLRTHRISNRALILALTSFSIFSLIQSRQIYLITFTFVAFLALPLVALGIGGGDVKLTGVLALFFLPSSWVTVLVFTSVFSSIALVQVLAVIIRNRCLTGSIALAPSICGAVIWCAR